MTKSNFKTTALVSFVVLMQVVFVGASMIPMANAEESTVVDEPTVSVEQTDSPNIVVSDAVIEETNVLSDDITPVEELTPVVVETVVEEQTPSQESAPVAEEPIIEEQVSSQDSVAPIVEEVVVQESSSEDSVVTTTPVLTTDKADYNPGQTATIFGNFFQALQDIILTIFGGSTDDGTYTESTQNVTADSGGSFITTYILDNLFRPLYTIIASALDGTQLAQTTFTDPPSVDFKQCANDRNEPAGTCDWIGSILQANNSVYFEGMSVPQRLLYRGIGDGAHTISFKYSYTKGGTHAYDFITGKNQGNGSFSPSITTFNDCGGLSGADLTACTALIATTENFVSIPNDSFDSKDSAPVPGVGTSQTAKEIAYGARSISVYNTGTMSLTSISPITHDVAANGDTGDSDAQVTFNFTLASCGGGCNVMLYFDGHLAVGGSDNTTGVNWGPALGSSNINGGPYHVKNIQLDGSGGSLDNQIQGASILVPNDATITIIKDTVPNDPQDFSYTTTGSGLSSFSLDDDGETLILSNTKVFSSLAPGAYTVTEAAQAGFDLTGNVTCTDATSDSSINLGTGVATINLAASENVTCTFVNTKRGTIIVEKQTSPDAAAGSFTFTGTAAGTISDNGQITVGNLVPGTYTSTEADPSPAFALTGLSCDDGASATPSTTNVGTRTATFELDPGETVICTFTNTLQTGHIVVDKVTDPPSDPQSFSFLTTGSGYAGFSLTDAAAPNDQTLNAGAYSVSETVPAGWDLTNTNCVSSIGDTETAGSLELDGGETITCTFTNQKDANIIVVKQTDPDGDPASFEFDPSYAANFFLTDGNSNDSGDLVPGTYSVAEIVPAGWDLTLATCTDGTPASISLQAGETVTCTFNDQKDAVIIVDKVTDPSGDPTLFDFTTDYGSPFSLADATTPNNSGDLAPGTYSVTEAAEPGWDLTNTNCVSSIGDTETAGSLELDGGETITCTFTNTKRGHIIIVKDAIPNNAQDFTFNNNFGNGNPAIFFLDDDSNITLSNTRDSEVLPGTYAVSEDAVAGWKSPKTTSCTDGSPVGAIVVSPGETVTCTFTNQKLATIILVKNTVGGDAQFNFTTTGGDGLPANPSLTTVGGTASTTFNNIDPDLTYSIGETVPAGWDLTSSTCTGTNTPASITPNAGEIITCTFTNTKRGHIIVDKVTDPSGDPQSFDFDALGGPSTYNDFSLTDVAAPNNQELKPGTYAVAETVPSGWDLTSATCSDQSDPSSISLQAGETVTCTFNNQADAFIIVDKVTDPAGDPTEFDFTTNYGSPFVLADVTTPNNSGDLIPGTYSVAEAAEASWDLTSATCDDGSPVGAIVLSAGEIVTCTFNNTQRGHIIVDKVTIGGDATFAFDANGGSNPAYADFNLSGADTPNNQELKPGSYSVSEGALAGWDQTSAVCDNQQTPGSITLAAGQTIICTFTNTKLGRIIVEKQTLPNGSQQQFSFTGDIVATLGDGGGASTDNLLPGTYSVTESPVGGWDLTSIVCDDSNSSGDTLTGVATYQLEAGEIVKCTFTNTQRGHIILEKQTLPDGSQQVFDFDMSYGDNDADLMDGQTDDTEVVPGTYSASENVPTGWDLTSATCSDQSPVSAIVVGAGETVTCVFTNTQRGYIIVDKITNPAADPQSFSFTAGGAGYSNFSLTDAAAPNNQEVVPGAYTVSETVPTGWDLTSATCDLGETPASLDVGPGETVTCTFTNTKRAKITIVKDAQPNDCQNFAFAMTGQNNFSLDDDSGVVDCVDTNQPQSQTFSNLVPGSFTTTETLPNAFWEFGGVACVNTVGGTSYPQTNVSNGVTVDLIPGADVTCTFVNNKLGPTRTLGFWQTHVTYTSGVFSTPANTFPWFAAGNMTVGSGIVGGSQDPLDTINKVFGGFWSNIAKKTDKSNRSALDKARMQLAQQLLAAELNCAAFGCPVSIQTAIANANTNYAGTSVSAILASASALDGYNNSGDTITIGPAGKADPKTAKFLASYLFWDTP